MSVMLKVSVIIMKKQYFKMCGNCVAARKEVGLPKGQLRCSVNGNVVDVTLNVDDCFVTIKKENNENF